MSRQTPDKPLAVRLPSDRRAALQKIAESEHRTLSQEVRFLIDKRIAEHKKAA